MAVVEHVVTLDRIRTRSATMFRGICSCGEKGEWVLTSGMVAGGFDIRHREEMERKNRFPELTALVADYAVLAKSFFDRGDRDTAMLNLEESRARAERLRLLLAGARPTNPEQMALDILRAIEGRYAPETVA